MSDQQSMAQGDFENQIITRAWKDAAFAEELRRNPKATLQRELDRLQPGTGIRIPDNVEVKVVENTPSTFYLVLPQKPTPQEAGKTGSELSDADLEAVAGGMPSNCLWIMWTLACTTTD